MFRRRKRKQRYEQCPLSLNSVPYLPSFTWHQSVSFDGFLYGGTAFIGAETPIGPLYLGYGYTEGGRNRWYLAIGDHF